MAKRQSVRAFDELTFGADGTLNLRDSLPTAADARFRAEAWLRQRQALVGGEVMIITGAGKNSPDGIGVIKEEILALLCLLRRQGVVKSWREHSLGSVAVQLATMEELLSAPRRFRDSKRSTQTSREAQLVFHGLDGETEKLLRQLAEASLSDLGMHDSEGLIEGEMARQLSIFVRALDAGANNEDSLRTVIIRAIEELDVEKHK